MVKLTPINFLSVEFNRDIIVCPQIEDNFTQAEIAEEPVFDGATTIEAILSTRSRIMRFFIENILPENLREDTDIRLRSQKHTLTQEMLGIAGRQKWHSDPFPNSVFEENRLVGLCTIGNMALTDILDPIVLNSPSEADQINPEHPHRSFESGTYIQGDHPFLHRRGRVIKPGLRYIIDVGRLSEREKEYLRSWEECY